MKKVKIITTCPSCSSELERVKDQLFCRNNNCLAKQEKKLIQFAKVMKIKGLGPKTLEKLDILSILDLYLLREKDIIDSIGEKLGIKLYNEIQGSRYVTLEKLLPALSIDLIGTSAGRKLNVLVNTLDEITFDICKKAGLGDVATNNLCDWLENRKSVYEELPLIFEEVANANLLVTKNIKVCITGKLDDYKSRDLASKYLREQGITVASGVSKTLDFLINEDKKPSSKLSKAGEYGIPIVTIKQLIEEIK